MDVDQLIEKCINDIIPVLWHEVACMPGGSPAPVGAACYITSRPNRAGRILLVPDSKSNRTVDELKNNDLGSIDPSVAPKAWIADAHTASPEDLLKAARHVAEDMRSDLDRYFGIVVVIEQDADQVTLKMNMRTEEEKAKIRPIANYIKSSRKANESDEQLVERIRRWLLGRERLMRLFTWKTKTIRLDLGTRFGTGNESLPALEAGPVFAGLRPDFRMNPFTWRTPDGYRTLKTDTCREYLPGPYDGGRAYLAFSVAAILLHELGHVEGCLLNPNSSACRGIGRDDVNVEAANTTDSDLLLGAHPDFGLRVKGGGHPNQYTRIDDTTVDIYDPKKLVTGTERPGPPWFFMSNERVMRSGTLDPLVDLAAARKKEIMDFLASVHQLKMRPLCMEFRKIYQRTFKNDELYEMRDWYTSQRNREREVGQEDLYRDRQDHLQRR